MHGRGRTDRELALSQTSRGSTYWGKEFHHGREQPHAESITRERTSGGLTKSRLILWSGLGAVGLFGAIGGAWILSLPPVASNTAAPPITKEEADAILTALKPKRQRPLIAIIGINDATEATDYLMPYGILRRSNVADVVMLATGPGPVQLYPALRVEPQATVEAFDAQHPAGADYVIVPAMSRDDDPAVLEWLRSQATRGALIIGVCAGAKVVGEARLLDGKRGTTHWYYLEELRDKHPAMRYVADRRLVVDQGVATTTGISASMPMSLTLIEAIAGRDTAEAVGRDIGVTQWDARHHSSAFQFTRPFALTAIANTLAFWNREQLGIEVTPGIDEVSLALVSDAWSRTYRSRAETFSRGEHAVTRNGVRVIPAHTAGNWPEERLLPTIGNQPPVRALHEALRGIGVRYGIRTAEFVAMQLEYPTISAPR
jgi:putative intracellular protease/amidase